MNKLPPALKKAFGIPEEGEPKEYLEIERLNDKLDSFEYSFRKASISRASALRARGRAEIERQFGAEFAAFGLDGQTIDKVLKLATKYREAEKGVTKKIESLLIEIRAGGLTSTEGKKEESEDTGGFLGFMKGGETEGKKEDGEDKA